MIHFITPLAAKKSVKNWPLTCQLLQQTLGSLENQDFPSFQATICCHDIPDFATTLDSRFKFVVSPYPPPSDARTLTGENSGLHDQTLKRDIALMNCGAQSDDLVMLLDADDLYHRCLVGELNQTAADVQAVIISKGYELCYRSKRMVKRSDINHRTASSFGLRAHLLNIPISHDEKDLSASLYRKVWHSNLEVYLKENSLKCIYMPEPRTVYVTNTTLNFSDFYRTTLIRRIKHWSKFYLIGHPITKIQLDEFGIKI